MYPWLLKELTHYGQVTPYDDKSSGSKLAQVMAWCLTAPSHYLGQCWLISWVLWDSPTTNFTGSTQDIYSQNEFEKYTCEMTFDDLDNKAFGPLNIISALDWHQGKKVNKTSIYKNVTWTLQWRHNERDGVSNDQPHDCSLNRLSQAQIKEKVKAPRHWPLCGVFTGHRWIPRIEGQ